MVLQILSPVILKKYLVMRDEIFLPLSSCVIHLVGIQTDYATNKEQISIENSNLMLIFKCRAWYRTENVNQVISGKNSKTCSNSET